MRRIYIILLFVLSFISLSAQEIEWEGEDEVSVLEAGGNGNGNGNCPNCQPVPLDANTIVLLSIGILYGIYIGVKHHRSRGKSNY